MPELQEQMFCSQQIVIPPNFPYILKKYAKAAIKTQPYDLLRWSFEYFKALAEKKVPPVKLRLEYPIFNTEGGLTRGYLKVLANQLTGVEQVPLPILKNIWLGACLDYHELRRILCLCEVYLREEYVSRLQFLAVAGGLLTKSLTHTMILLCETLTKEPDGGSACIPLDDFLNMYMFLARMDASSDFKYINGYREGFTPEETSEEEADEVTPSIISEETGSSDSYWPDVKMLRLLTVIDDKIAMTPRISMKLNMPIIGKLERSPSIERASQIERENRNRERRDRLSSDPDIDHKLRIMSSVKFSKTNFDKDESKPPMPKIDEKLQEKDELLRICVLDEDDNEIPFVFYGEPKEVIHVNEDNDIKPASDTSIEQVVPEETEAEKVALFVAECRINSTSPLDNKQINDVVNTSAQCYNDREERLEDLSNTFDEIAALVDRFQAANYDLGVIAGRQMSSTSGEFIARYIERDIMDYINEQIGILPDPDLKKKKAKPEEVAMIKELLEQFLDDNMDIIVPELEEAEEEELPIPEITQVYAVPGIGPPVDEEIIREFIEYAHEVCKTQAELFMPRNIRHFMCPPLEKYVEQHYSIDLTQNTKYEPQHEEAPKEGIILE